MKEKEEIIMIVENAANQIKLAIQRGIAINTPQLMIITECNQEIEKARKSLLELTDDKEFIEEEIKGLKLLLIRWMNGYLVGVNKIAKENKSHILGNVLSQYQLLNKEGTPAKAIKNGGLTIVDTSKKDLFLANQGISNIRDLMTNPTEGGVGRYVDYGKKIRDELLSLQEKYAEDPSAFVDAKGNKKNLRLMAEIKVRYDLISDDLKGKDVKYVMASSHPNASERCSWWQGKLFKVDIDVESRQMHQYIESKSQALCKPLPQSEWIDNIPTYSLKTAIECGFLSYNCQHRLIKYYKGVKAPQYDLITVEKKRNLTSYQRALENKIRKTKLIEKVNGRNYPIERKNVFTGEMEQMTAVEYSKMLQDKYEDFCQKNGLVQYTWRLRITMEERGNATPNENNLGGITEKAIETPNEIINAMPDTPPCNRAFKQIEELNEIYVNKCTKVVKGGSRLQDGNVAGHIDPESGVMTLSHTAPDTVTHEFAHSISFAGAEEWGFKRDDKFWDKIEEVRNNYLKALKEDRRNLISEYATNANGAKGINAKLDEFMAEAFTLAYNYKTNKLRTTSVYNVTPESLKWANEVLSIVDEFYKRGNKQ